MQTLTAIILTLLVAPQAVGKFLAPNAVEHKVLAVGDANDNAVSVDSSSHKSAVHGAELGPDTKKPVEGHGSFYAMCVYAAAVMVMTLVVTFMFRGSGASVVAQVVMYVCCLAFIKIAMKEVFRLGFKYPKFVTSLHLLLSSGAAFIVMAKRKFVNGEEFVVPSSKELFYCILPIALMFGLSIGSENSALLYVSAAFSEVVAASNPVMSAFLTWATGLPFNFHLLAPILVVVTGCIISIKGELAFSAFGSGMLLFAVFCRGMKAVMQQKVLTGATKDKFDPCTLMAWTCLYSFIYMAAYSAATEGAVPIQLLGDGFGGAYLLGAILASCAIACTLNISALFVIKELGAVGMQMVSQMKSLLVVLGGVTLLSETFTLTQQIGFGIILGGVWWYSQMKLQLNPDAKGH